MTAACRGALAGYDGGGCLASSQHPGFTTATTTATKEARATGARVTDVPRIQRLGHERSVSLSQEGTDIQEIAYKFDYGCQNGAPTTTATPANPPRAASGS